MPYSPLYFFDIPVYGISEEKYYEERENFINEHFLLKQGREFYDRNPDHKLMLIDHLEQSFGGMWQYNEIIGYIRLYVLGSQIRGEYFANKAKRHVRTRKKQFIYLTHKLAPEINLPLGLDNQAIYERIMAYLNNCKKELPKRFVDTRDFELLGSYIDWKKLLYETLGLKI